MPDASEEATRDVDIDTEMGDTQEISTSRNPNETSSTTLDHEFSQAETQPASSAAHHNRKDATLREFLSKMDDYAPIVRDSLGLAWPSHSITIMASDL